MSETYFFNKNSILPLVFVFVMAVVSVGVWIGEQVSEGTSQDEAAKIWQQMKWHPAQAQGYTYIHFFDRGDRGAKAIQGTTSRGKKSPPLGSFKPKACYQWRIWPKHLQMGRTKNRGNSVFSSSQRGYVFVTLLKASHPTCKKMFVARQTPAQRRQVTLDRPVREKRLTLSFAQSKTREVQVPKGKCLYIEEKHGIFHYGYRDLNGQTNSLIAFINGIVKPFKGVSGSFTNLDRQGYVSVTIAPLGATKCRKAFVYNPG